jgi:hypothetical protein
MDERRDGARDEREREPRQDGPGDEPRDEKERQPRDCKTVQF